MTDDQIEVQIKSLIHIERRTTNEILKLIQLAESRDLPLKRGFSSTFDWLTTGLGYSSSAAFRRIQSARLVAVVPGAEQKLAAGEVNLTTLSKAQSAIRAAERHAGTSMSPARKKEVVDAITRQTSDQVDATLLELMPETASDVRQERARRIAPDVTRLMFNLGKEAMENLAWAIDYLSHVVPDGSHAGVFTKVLDVFRKAAEKKPTAKAKRRRCEFTDEITGRRCGQTFMIEVDHIVPRAKGGTDEAKNLRCLCRDHNQMMARRWLGKTWAESWRKRRGPGPEPAHPKPARPEAPATG